MLQVSWVNLSDDNLLYKAKLGAADLLKQNCINISWVTVWRQTKLKARKHNTNYSFSWLARFIIISPYLHSTREMRHINDSAPVITNEAPHDCSADYTDSIALFSCRWAVRPAAACFFSYVLSWLKLAKSSWLQPASPLWLARFMGSTPFTD